MQNAIAKLAPHSLGYLFSKEDANKKNGIKTTIYIFTRAGASGGILRIVEIRSSPPVEITHRLAAAVVFFHAG